MATDTILSENLQQFADDEIVDGFAAGPDDGVPLGLGGEKGRQAEPASSTLEADMVAGTKIAADTETLPAAGDAIPPTDGSAGGEPTPVQAAPSDEVAAKPAADAPEKPEAAEFPDQLLLMAGFSSADDAKAAGFKDPDALLAAVQWQSRVLSAPAKPSRKSYVDPATPETQPTTIPVEPAVADGSPTYKPFKPSNPDVFDEELLKLIDEQNRHNAAQFAELSARLRNREAGEQQNAALRQVEDFDRAVQNLGDAWVPEFGKGGGDELFGRTDAEGVAAAQARLDLFDAVNLLRQTNQQRGGKPMTTEQEVQWAVMQRYPEKFKQQLLRDRATKAQARRGVQASRPTARKAPLNNKDERTLSALAAKYPNVDFTIGDNEIGGEF